MITNPKIGMRVKYISFGSVRFNHIGTIISTDNSFIEVRFDTAINFMNDYMQDWPCAASHLQEIIPLSLEEQFKLEEQQRRQAHADRYL